MPPELQQLQSLFGARRSVIRLLGYLLLHHITPFRITHPSFASCLCPGPLCILTCSSDELRRQAGPWEFEYAQFGAVLLGPMCAALSSDVPTERWGVGVRAHSGTVCIAIVALCLLPGPMCTARARTFLAERWDRGSTGAQRCLLLRPLGSLAPHLCVVRAISAKYTQRGYIASALHQLRFFLPPYIHTISVDTKNAQKCLAKVLSKYTFFRLRAEQNSVEFYFLVFLCFLLF